MKCWNLVQTNMENLIANMNKKNVEGKLLWMYGFLGTMPLLTFFGLTLFSWLTVIVMAFIGISILTNPEHTVRFKFSFYIIICLCSIVSCIICYFSDIPEKWKNDQWKNIIWTILYLLIFLYYLGKQGEYARYYLKGIYTAAVFQMFWGYGQFVLYKLFAISLNDVIFVEKLHLFSETVTQMKGTDIALTGLSWNVGFIAALILWGYMLSKSKWLKVLFIVFAVISESRTLQVGIAICLLFQIIVYLSKQRMVLHISWCGFIGMWVLIGIGIISIVVLKYPEVFMSVRDSLNAFSTTTLKTEQSAIIHIRYLLSVPLVTQWNDLIHNIFGYGIGNSGYPFIAIFNQFGGTVEGAWVVECDYINQLWSCGYIGFCLLYGWYIYQIIRGGRINKKYIVLFGAILIEGFTYNVIFNWCMVAMLYSFIMIDRNEDIFEIVKNKRRLVW